MTKCKHAQGARAASTSRGMSMGSLGLATKSQCAAGRAGTGPGMWDIFLLIHSSHPSWQPTKGRVLSSVTAPLCQDRILPMGCSTQGALPHHGSPHHHNNLAETQIQIFSFSSDLIAGEHPPPACYWQYDPTLQTWNTTEFNATLHVKQMEEIRFSSHLKTFFTIIIYF